MKEFLIGLYIEHGDRAFTRCEEFGLTVYGKARNAGYISYIPYIHHVINHAPFKLTPKALEYIKSDAV